MDVALPRPSYKNCAYGNALAFGASIAAFVFEYFWHAPGAGIFEYFFGGLAAIVGGKLGLRAIAAFYKDFNIRRSWIKAQRPATEKHDGRWATKKECFDAGMYSPKGRLLGIDEDGYLLFIPHNLKPSFEYILCPQGGGKTTTRVIFSSLLSALIKKRDRRIADV